MGSLPLFHKVGGQVAVLVGGGQVAARKARLLLAAGMHLRVVAPEICSELLEQLDSGAAPGTHLRQERAYRGPGDLADAILVVVATPDRAVNARVADDARGLRIPVNVVDSPALCSFYFPALVDRSPLLVAIGSDGSSPVLARQLRSRIEAMLPAALGRLADFAAHWRQAVATALPDLELRRRFWEQLFDGPVASRVLAGRDGEAQAMLEAALEDAGREVSLGRGEVYLIGAGPGDPDLMTFKALRLLQQADIVLYDRLVNPAILDLARRDAERHYVGKRRGAHSVPQTELNQQLLDLARQGRRVARLKGGDPFIFGRGGEEIQLLAQHRVPFQVVPGITAASGAACYAGIPLTHRDHAQSVRFVAGYLKGDRVEHDWATLCQPGETLVFYMGLVGLPEICRQLLRHGRPADTPVALVERATYPEQRTITGSLATIAGRVAAAQPQAPTLIIVGDVVRLHDSLAWFAAGNDLPASD